MILNKKTTLVLLAFLCTLTVSAQRQQKKVYDESINQLEQIEAAVAKANAEGKYVICQVGGNWCPWCLRFADFITTDSDISQLIAANYVYIHVNYNPSKSESGEKKVMGEQALRRLGNPSRFGYPVLVVLNDKGNVIHTQDSAFLEEGKSYNKEHVMRFFKCWTPEAVKGGSKNKPVID